jgi:hypothetical protein
MMMLQEMLLTKHLRIIRISFNAYIQMKVVLAMKSQDVLRL